MEGQSGLLKLSIISWVSAVEGCSLSGVPLYDKDQVTAKATNSTSERARISWNLAEASRQCCLCSFVFHSSARGPSGIMVRASN